MVQAINACYSNGPYATVICFNNISFIKDIRINEIAS